MCVGPRSAVFAPLRDIGLIVVDEEHEGSYKHEGDPRYDARAVAERARARARRRAAGSAAPRRGPRARSAAAPAPAAAGSTAVRCRRSRCSTCAASTTRCTRETRMALADLRRAGGKAIVLLNRRGWSNFLSCRSCGDVWMCPNCEVALVLHRGEEAASPATTAGTASRCPTAARSARRWRSRATAPEPSASSTSCRGAGRRRLPGAPPRRRRGRRWTRGRGRWSGSKPRQPACSSARRWWPRATTSPTSRSGVVLDADQTLALPGLPRRGADVRAGHPARRARGARRARRPRARPDARAGRALDPLRRPPRRRRLPRRRAGPAPRRCATRRSRR